MRVRERALRIGRDNCPVSWLLLGIMMVLSGMVACPGAHYSRLLDLPDGRGFITNLPSPPLQAAHWAPSPFEAIMTLVGLCALVGFVYTISAIGACLTREAIRWYRRKRQR